MNRLVLALVVALASVTTARMAFVFPDGVEATFGARDIQTSFSCADRVYGYYADMANDCKVFHVCYPISDDAGALLETAHFSFLCGNNTVFSQESLTCSFQEDAYPCQESDTLYDVSNAEFGVIPERII